MADRVAMPTCPMAKVCQGMMEKRGFGVWMIVPGLMFIVLGVAIIFYPKILVWLVAAALIVMGLGMLMMLNVMRNFGNRIHNKPA